MAHQDDPEPHDPRIPACDPVDSYQRTCPLGGGWVRWDLGSSWREGLPAEADALAERAERAHGVRLLDTLNPRWVWAFDDPSRRLHEVGDKPAGDSATNSSHVQPELMLGGQCVHTDWVTITRSGPGRSLLELRIFINGAFAGRGGRGGCSLGGYGYSLPAVALVGRRRALVVDGGQRVRLWQVRARKEGERREPFPSVVRGDRRQMPTAGAVRAGRSRSPQSQR